MNVRLHDEQRQSCTISSFFLRVPRRDKLWLPQCGQASGCFVVRGARAMRGNGRARGGLGSDRAGSIRERRDYRCRLPHLTPIERTGRQLTGIGRGVHEFCTACASRILYGACSARGQAEARSGRWLMRWMRNKQGAPDGQCALHRGRRIPQVAKRRGFSGSNSAFDICWLSIAARSCAAISVGAVGERVTTRASCRQRLLLRVSSRAFRACRASSCVVASRLNRLACEGRRSVP